MHEKEDAAKLVADANAVEMIISQAFPQFTAIFIKLNNKFDVF